MYSSPLLYIENDPLEFKVESSMRYSSSVNQLLQEYHRMINNDTVEAWNAWHPPRLIKAAIDYKIQHPKEKKGFYLVQRAISLALDTYAGRVTRENLIEFECFSKSLSLFMDGIISQEEDNVTWRSSRPKLSKDSAKEIHARSTDNVLLIALGHGGTAIGMDIFLHYLDMYNPKDSTFYVTRLSRMKKKDNEPILNRLEKQYLLAEQIDKHVVICDEDTSTGTTMKIADDFFTDFFKRDDIQYITNGNGSIDWDIRDVVNMIKNQR